jgi:hypothetical protein
MPSSSFLVNSVRDTLSNPSTIPPNAFAIVQSISRLWALGEEVTAQELILRSLEHRELFGECRPILDALIREVGLFPFLEVEDLGLSDALAYEYHKPVNMEATGVVFHRPQARVYRELLAGNNIVLSAPTSFGKSLVIDGIVASRKYSNILVVVPTIALIDETRRRLSILTNEYKIITHRFQQPVARNVYILTQERVLDHPNLDDIDFFVIDEFYKLTPGRDEDERSALLNHVFYLLARKRKPFYLLGPNVSGVSPDFQSRLEFQFIHEPYQTVVSELHKVELQGDEFDTLASLCRELTGPTIIFCQSPGRASEVASQLVQREVCGESEALRAAVDWVGAEYHPNWHFTQALRYGIGVHHGRIPRALSQFVVRAFDFGLMQFLVCTSTLIEGVNTKAENVIIFDKKINRKNLDYFTFNNIRGRSGRMKKHYVGHVYLFHDPPAVGLPVVDVPAFTQSEGATDSLLLQLDEDDLTEDSQQRLSGYKAQRLLSYETLKANAGVDPNSQIAVARTIFDNPNGFYPLLSWTQTPSWDQLLTVCQLMWDNFGGQGLGGGSVRSFRQLATRINRLRGVPTTRTLIEEQLKYDSDPDQAVPSVLDFLRLWANFHFPRLLRAIDQIQKDVFGTLDVRPGDYESFATRVEHFFMDPALVALDEYGVPLQLARKLRHYLAPNGNLDDVLARLKRLDVATSRLHPFEVDVLLDAQEHIVIPA